MIKRSEPTGEPSGVQMGWAATSTLLGGLVVWGGVGWLLDFWWGTSFATPVGAIIGMALGIYAVVMRYGRAPEESTEKKTQQSDDPARGSQPASLER